MEIKDLQPTQALKNLLSGKVKVEISDTESRVAQVYKQGERPSVDLGDEFIDVLNNGVIRAMTKPLGVFRGNLAVVLYCKANNDGTVKSTRIKSMLSQVESLVNYKSSDKFYFELNTENLITPISTNNTTGYTTTTLNIEWQTTE